MEDHSYNGWKNYETWNVSLWIDNEAGSYAYWRDAAKDCYEGARAEKPFSKMERAGLNLAERLKDEITDGAPEVSGCYADLLYAALTEVDWYEIAENLLSELEEQP